MAKKQAKKNTTKTNNTKKVKNAQLVINTKNGASKKGNIKPSKTPKKEIKEESHIEIVKDVETSQDDVKTEEVVSKEEKESTPIIEPTVDSKVEDITKKVPNTEKAKENTSSDNNTADSKRENKVEEVSKEDTPVEPKEDTISKEKVVINEVKNDSLDETKTLDVVNESIKEKAPSKIVPQDRKKVSFLDSFKKPSEYIESLEYDNSSISSNLLKLFVRHGLCIIGIIYYITKVLNADAFSFVRLTFTQASWLWFRVVLFLLLCDVLASLLFSLITKKKLDSKLMSQMYYYTNKVSIEAIVLVNLIGIGLFINIFVGVLLIVFTIIYLFYIKFLILKKLMNSSNDSTMWNLQLFYFMFVGFLCIFVNLFFQDISQILNALF